MGLPLSAFLLALFSVVSATEAQDNSAANAVIPAPIWYEPGRLETLFDNRFFLSKGLTAKVIAKANELVQYSNGSQSSVPFHTLPDGAAVFKDGRNTNPGGWVLVSNSEDVRPNGGVGGITFDTNGEVVEYRRLLTGTDRNCNGGKTDWETWISCEESFNADGKCWQVDPFDKRSPVPISLGSQGGSWETFAHDTRDPSVLNAFITEDSVDGRLSRMTYKNPNYTDPWQILLQPGSLDYLVLHPRSFFDQSSGTFRWTPNEQEARENALLYYPNTEGMKIDGNLLRVVSKTKEGFFLLDLDKGTYTFEVPDFEGQPDQSTTAVMDDGSKLIFFTEEANPVLSFLGSQVGIHTRNEAGVYCAVLFGEDSSPETTGIAFSPDGLHLYFAYQEDGVLFDVTRLDGRSFFDPSGGVTSCTYGDSYEDDGDWSFLDWVTGLFGSASRQAEDDPF